MKKTKMIVVAAIAALAMSALAGAGSAQAATYVQSCEGENCQPASVGTTFTMSGDFFTGNGIFSPVQCDFTLENEVVDGTSEGGSDSIEISVSGASFSSCNSPVTAESVPWTLSTNEALFSKSGTINTGGVRYTINLGSVKCTFADTQTQFIKLSWANGASSEASVWGSAPTVPGSHWACGKTWTTGGDLTVVSASDPEFPEADNIQIGE